MRLGSAYVEELESQRNDLHDSVVNLLEQLEEVIETASVFVSRLGSSEEYDFETIMKPFIKALEEEKERFIRR